MAEAKFYTYVHRKADTGVVFYVGKGQGPRAFDKTCRSVYWKRIAAKHGVEVEIVGRFHEESEAFAREVELIAEYRAAGFNLCNQTSGGDGAPDLTPESKAKKSASLSAAMNGRVMSAAHRSAMSAAHKGKPLSESHRAGLKKRIYSPDHGKKIAASNAIPEVNARRKAAISATMKGYVKSDEHRANLSRAAKEDWARRKAKLNTA